MACWVSFVFHWCWAHERGRVLRLSAHFTIGSTKLGYNATWFMDDECWHSEHHQSPSKCQETIFIFSHKRFSHRIFSGEYANEKQLPKFVRNAFFDLDGYFQESNRRLWEYRKTEIIGEVESDIRNEIIQALDTRKLLKLLFARDKTNFLIYLANSLCQYFLR